jgi:hypothetical protein
VRLLSIVIGVPAMPVLRNAKWERFCLNVFQSTKTRWSLARCYEEAGYQAVGHSSEMAASRLMKNDEIRMRIAELSRPVAKKAGLSLEALTLRIGEAIDAAKADGAHGAIAQNHGLLLKIADMVRERDEAEQMQFAGATDAEGILDAIRDLVGDVVAAEVQAAITSSVYATDIGRALEIIDGIRADLLARVSATAVLVS